MGDYAEAARFYDLLYSAGKDYAKEAELVSSLIRDRHPAAKSVLDVGCGTGAHARGLIDLGFEVDGVDIEPAFVEIAATKCPEGRFMVGDMRSLAMPATYDAVVCLFSAIGYALDLEGLSASVAGMARQLAPGGVVLVDPWFQPQEMTPDHIATTVGSDSDTEVVRMSRTRIEGAVSTLEFEYLIGTSAGIERRSEVHELGLFTERQMVAAFDDAGLVVERVPKALRTRGIYVAIHQ